MANFVSVPAEVIEAELRARSFSRTVQREEVVYVRHHEKNPDVLIKVYTSIRVGRTSARDCGKDSIKACCVFDNGRRSFGLGKFEPVFRVGSVEAVLDRMLDRARRAYARGTEWIQEQEQREANRLAEKAEEEVASGHRDFNPRIQVRSLRRNGMVQGGVDP